MQVYVAYSTENEFKLLLKNKTMEYNWIDYKTIQTWIHISNRFWQKWVVLSQPESFVGLTTVAVELWIMKMHSSKPLCYIIDELFGIFTKPLTSHRTILCFSRKTENLTTELFHGLFKLDFFHSVRNKFR